MKKGYKECPFCANEIKEGAIKCQFCKERLDMPEKINNSEEKGSIEDGGSNNNRRC